ncbi:MAG: AbrB/MazE/SpoVT family DNA-binding domain-containing protein [Desulfurococcales archaeon]|nr:AbrB/MazE/SpoVT family DNA-binding domain-containing protein [Desulfurococcales archaeon]MCE4604911.1 AbrB/MazE/SpoVT family DNA-binding domain-containing protein [Desulfurococcales archaeon]
MTRKLRVGRKRAIYLPREILDALDLREGDPVVVKVEDNRIIIERAPDPFLLAARRSKWASTTVEEFEEESEREQEDWNQ